jgi:hypothetical protein
MSFFMEGRLIVIERFEDESDASFAERSTFILYFRNDPAKFAEAKKLSFHHVTKMFQGVTYSSEVENQLKQYRDEAKQIKQEVSI